MKIRDRANFGSRPLQQKPVIDPPICITGFSFQSDNVAMNLFRSLDSSTHRRVSSCSIEEARAKASQDKIIGYLIIDDNFGEKIFKKSCSTIILAIHLLFGDSMETIVIISTSVMLRESCII